MRCLNCGRDKLSLDTDNCPQCGVYLPSLMQNCLAPGTFLWHETYRIDYPLGRGGFGITYRAFDTSLDRPVAVKEFYPQEHATRDRATGKLIALVSRQDAYQRGLNRFLQEGYVLAKLDHPGVVRVHNAFQERGTAYLVMELVSGRTLRSEIDEQPGKKLKVERVKQVMSKLVDALSVVHQQDIYHLDLAPDNIMVTPEGRVVLVDFGASRQGLGTNTTQAFKEAYAPPEVINGKTTGPESDVFELGVMLHEMLTGELPPPSISRLFSVVHQSVELWDSSQLEEPWRGLVAGAIRLKQQERPHTVIEWWNLVDTPRDGRSSTNDSDSKPSPTSPPLKPANFWLRAASDLIDRTILIVGSVVLQIVLIPSATSVGEYFVQFLVFYIILGFIYSPVMDSSPKQGTLGKMMMGIAVTNKSGRRVNFRQASTRHACKVFSYVTLCIGFFMAGFTKNKQALHDIIAKCFVIRRN